MEKSKTSDYLTIYADLHLGAPHQMLLKLLEYGPDVIYAGDIFDRKNTRRSKLDEINEDYSQHLRKCARTGTVDVDGNHELVQNNHYVIIEIDKIRILVIHGDEIDYGYNGMIKWRSKKAGTSSFKWYLRKYFQGKRLGRKKSLSKKTIVEAARIADTYPDIDVVLFAHYHLKKTRCYSCDGKVIISVPRGETRMLKQDIIDKVMVKKKGSSEGIAFFYL